VLRRFFTHFLPNGYSKLLEITRNKVNKQKKDRQQFPMLTAFALSKSEYRCYYNIKKDRPSSRRSKRLKGITFSFCGFSMSAEESAFYKALTDDL
jgi:hypothetical protein